MFLKKLTSVLWIWSFFIVPITYAQPDLETLYINPQGETLPNTIIFYNSANSCHNCPKAINMIIKILKENYIGRMHVYLIDIAKQPEFIKPFQLTGPLNVVFIRISDGASFGYAKLTGLQSMTSDNNTLRLQITEKINNFLNISPKN